MNFLPYSKVIIQDSSPLFRACELETIGVPDIVIAEAAFIPAADVPVQLLGYQKWAA